MHLVGCLADAEQELYIYGVYFVFCCLITVEEWVKNRVIAFVWLPFTFLFNISGPDLPRWTGDVCIAVVNYQSEKANWQLNQ